MMSVAEARKHLDAKTNGEMSDEQVEALVKEAYTFADFAIDVYLSEKKLKK